jgi:hypothetical protein
MCFNKKIIQDYFVPQSSEDETETIAITCRFAADVLKQNSQFILLLRECLRSYGIACLIPDEKRYDKRDDFNFSIVNFPYLCSNTPASPAYGVYISQLLRYARACSAYDQFLLRGNLLTKKLMSQGFQMSHLQAAFRKVYGRYNDLIHPYNLSLGHMLFDMFHNNH